MKEDKINEFQPLFITLGSNINPVENLNSAINDLKNEFANIKVSKFYVSAAVLGPLNKNKQEDYLNAAILASSDLNAEFIKFNVLRKIEKKLKRIRRSDKFAARTIDLDIALYGAMVTRTDKLIIPDPDILHYSHVIFPLCDLDPNFIHPVIGITLGEIKENVDKSNINIFEN